MSEDHGSCECKLCQLAAEHGEDEARRLYMKKISADVDEYGWSGVSVSSDGVTPPFTYTIGFLRADKPEICVVGLPPPSAHGILWSIWERNTFPTDVDLIGVARGLPVRLVEADEDIIENMSASLLYNELNERLPFRALQLVWPDPRGKFPGEEGYSMFPQSLRVLS